MLGRAQMWYLQRILVEGATKCCTLQVYWPRPETLSCFLILGAFMSAAMPVLSNDHGISPLYITLRRHQTRHPETWPGTWFLIMKVSIFDVSWMKLTVYTHLKFPHQTICPQRMGIINLEERRAVKRFIGFIWQLASTTFPLPSPLTRRLMISSINSEGVMWTL